MASSADDKTTSTYKSEPDKCENMMPNIFMQCNPITNVEDIEEVLQDPPQWVSRIQPLANRSPTVLQNIISDCHSDSKHFLTRNRFDARMVPKTLVCHDYKGGYLADKYLHEENEEILGNGYTFYNWAQIDIFVYFSHHFITIPPLSWINAGHSQGVKVFGTLITEFDDGSKICDEQIFSSLFEMRNFAKSLAYLTKIFGFDGWLLNIENQVKNVQILKEFVPYFTYLIHQDNPGNLVIWYDSVTQGGQLHWQNELNENNKYFFDCCDGIFLNYTWTETSLLKSVEMAEHRKFDVFVGIDIFGRNMYGGGKFNTFKAAELVSRYNLSMALFATGWTYESLNQSDELFQDFLNKDSAFWSSIWPYLYTHPVNDYFTTNFYIGLDQNCYNLFSQQTQLSKVLYPSSITDVPELPSIPTLNRICDCMQSGILEAKNTCLLTKTNLRKDIDYVLHLFACDIEILDTTLIYFLTRSIDAANPTRLSLTLLTTQYNGSFRKIKLLARIKDVVQTTLSVLEVNPLDDQDILSNIKTRYERYFKEDQWNISAYLINTPLSNILEIGGTIENGDSIYLGAFGIQKANDHYLNKFL